MNLNTTKFFNSTDVNISSRMNEYLKKNFGYAVDGDIATLREAKKSLELAQIELKDTGYMNRKYVENMLMIETISSLLKAHGEKLDLDDFSKKSPESISKQKKSIQPTLGDNPLEEEDDDAKFPNREIDRFGPEDDYLEDEEEVWFNYEDIGGNIIVNPKSTIEDQIAELLSREPYDISPMEFDPSKIEITTPDQTNQDANFAKTQNARNTPKESVKEDDGLIKRQDGKYDQADIAYGKDDYMIKKDPATGEYDPDEIRQMQYQQNIADPLNREIDSSKKAVTIEVDYDLELDKPKSQNPLLKKHYKEMRKFNVFISMPEWQEGPKDSGFGVWTAKVRGSKKNLLGWLKAWEFDYDKEQLDDMGLGESVKAVKEDDEEKGAEHYRWKNESQLAVALGRIESAMEELDHAIEYRGENSAKFFNNGDKAGVGSLMSIKGTLQKVLDRWEKDTEFYGM